MAAATVAALLALFKRLYQSRDLSNMALRKTPFFRKVPKKDDLYGEGIYIPYNHGLPVGMSANFTAAQANVKASRVSRWFVERKYFYAFHTIANEAIKASSRDVGAFLSVKQKELDEVVKMVGQEIGAHLWRDGSGVIGRTTTDPGTGTDDATITLENPRDAVNFHLGQILIANSALSGGTNRADAYEVVGVNRQTGVITMDKTAASDVDDWAANDYIFVDGNHGVRGGAAANSMLTGVEAWIPSADPSTTLLGMTRTDDPTMKAGWRGEWQGTIEESAKALAAQMGQYLDKDVSALWLSRYNWFRLEQELTSKNRKVMDARATETFGTPALALLTPEGEVPVMADPFCPDSSGFMLDHSSWEIHTMGGLPELVTNDGNTALRASSEAAIEVRFEAYMEAVCFRPFTNGRFAIS